MEYIFLFDALFVFFLAVGLFCAVVGCFLADCIFAIHDFLKSRFGRHGEEQIRDE